MVLNLTLSVSYSISPPPPFLPPHPEATRLYVPQPLFIFYIDSRTVDEIMNTNCLLVVKHHKKIEIGFRFPSSSLMLIFSPESYLENNLEKYQLLSQITPRAPEQTSEWAE